MSQMKRSSAHRVTKEKKSERGVKAREDRSGQNEFRERRLQELNRNWNHSQYVERSDADEDLQSAFLTFKNNQERNEVLKEILSNDMISSKTKRSCAKKLYEVTRKTDFQEKDASIASIRCSKKGGRPKYKSLNASLNKSNVNVNSCSTTNHTSKKNYKLSKAGKKQSLKRGCNYNAEGFSPPRNERKSLYETPPQEIPMSRRATFKEGYKKEMDMMDERIRERDGPHTEEERKILFESQVQKMKEKLQEEDDEPDEVIEVTQSSSIFGFIKDKLGTLFKRPADNIGFREADDAELTEKTKRIEAARERSLDIERCKKEFRKALKEVKREERIKFEEFYNNRDEAGLERYMKERKEADAAFL